MSTPTRIIAGLTLSIFMLIQNASATIPTSPPSNATLGVGNQWLFAAYFQNLDDGCALTEVLTSFQTSGINYLKPICKTVANVLGDYFFSLGLSGSPVVFTSAGVPVVYDFSGLTPVQSTNITNQLFGTNIPNNTFTSALTQFISTLTTQSQWKDTAWVWGPIAYTGSNVSIGTQNIDGKLYVAGGKVSIGDPLTEDNLPTWGNWRYSLQLNGVNNTSIGFNDNAASVSSIRYNNNGFVIGGDDGWGTRPVYIAEKGYFGTSSPSFAKTSIWYNSARGGEVDGGVGWLYLNWNNGTLGTHIGNGNNGYGLITAQGFLYSSDRSLKKDIVPLKDSLEKIMKISGYSYKWKSTDTKDMGVIAQEVEAVYPEIVHTNSEGIKSVEYANLIAPLIEAVKSQEKEIQLLKNEVASLKALK